MGRNGAVGTAAMLIVGVLLGAALIRRAEALEPVRIYFFWSEGCPYCEQQREFLAAMVEQYGPLIEVVEFEVVHNQENFQVFRDVASAHGTRATTIPTTFIGGSFWLGFQPRMEGEMEERLVQCLGFKCPDPGAAVLPRGVGGEAARSELPQGSPTDRRTGESTSTLQEISGQGQVASSTVTVPLVGEVDLAAESLAFATVIVAFVDGINPCSMWVLTMLLAIVVYTRSRLKTVVVGLTFLTVTAAVYGAFVAGAFNILSVIQTIPWITFVVAAIAFFFGLVNVKDYFFFRRGLSLTIDERHKPGIFKRMREVIAGDRSTLGMVGATVVMAAGIAIVELPCTAGFPLVWSGLVAAHHPSLGGFLLLLAVYITVYLLDELAVFGAVVVTMKTRKFEETHGRLLKLIGGTVMLALAVVLVVDKDVMKNLTGTLVVFGIAVGAAGLVVAVHRLALPRLGIVADGGGRGSPKVT